MIRRLCVLASLPVYGKGQAAQGSVAIEDGARRACACGGGPPPRCTAK